jgi:hypothetical protein
MRYRLIGVALLWLIALGVAAYARKPEPAPGRRIALDCVLTEFNAEGQQKKKAAPRLVTLESKTAKFLDGGEVAWSVGTGNDKEVEFVPFGFSAEMKPRLLKNGRVVLDVTIQDIQAEQAAEGTIRTRSTSARSMETVDFGDVVKLKLDRDRDKGGSYVFEVRVRDGDDATNRP